MEDNKKLVCVSCCEEFVFTSEEQEMYETLGFKNEPKRCRKCRGAQKAIDEAVKPKKIMYTVTCACCGMETQVPFQPKGDKPVYCMSCFKTSDK